MDESEAESRIRATFEQVDVWHRTPLFVPNVGSELRPDDDAWPYMSISQLSKVGLDVAAAHMFAVNCLVDAGQLLPFVHRSLLRTALVGAAQSVWLLAPEDAGTRQARHRTLMATMHKRHRQYLEGLVELTDVLGQPGDRNTGLVLEHVKQRQAELDELRESKGEQAKWNDTIAIQDSARAAWGALPNVDSLVQEALLEWQAGSGAAHGLVWSALGQAGTEPVTTADSDGLAVIVAGGSFLSIVNGYMLAYNLTGFGWKLLRARGL